MAAPSRASIVHAGNMGLLAKGGGTAESMSPLKKTCRRHFRPPMEAGLLILPSSSSSIPPSHSTQIERERTAMDDAHETRWTPPPATFRRLSARICRKCVTLRRPGHDKGRAKARPELGGLNAEFRENAGSKTIPKDRSGGLGEGVDPLQTKLADEGRQHLDALAEPCQFLVCDAVLP